MKMTILKSNGDHYLNYSHNLVGCPETRLWINLVYLFSDTDFQSQNTSPSRPILIRMYLFKSLKVAL